MSTTWRTERGRIAALTRSRPADDPELIEARRHFRATRLADHIAKALADAPPLTQEQRESIARLLVNQPRSGDVDG